MSDVHAENAPPEIVRAMGGNPPTGQQWAAIAHPLAPRAVIAGAGSGKTAVVAARVVWLVLERLAGREGAMPSEILCLTFTNKAAEELRRRVRDATAGLGLAEWDECTVLTYHAFGQSLLEEYGARMGLEPRAMLLSQAHRWQIAASLLADREFEYNEVRTLGTILRRCLDLNDTAADHCVTPQQVVEASLATVQQYAGRKGMSEVVEAAAKRAELAVLVGEYQEAKRRLGAFDFGDLISLANDLVVAHPDVTAAFRERYRMVLLDEYQDTNVAQARLLQTLCGGTPTFAVGDPDQNIYAWRGASLQNLLRFSADFGLGETSLPLFVNFRSGSRILAAADRVIAPVPEDRRPPDKTLTPHPSRGSGRMLAFVETDERAEARRIAKLIVEEAGARRDPAGGEPGWDAIAILCRKKRLFPAIAEVLRNEGIPLEVVDLGGLLRLPEVVDAVAWIRLLENPGRNIALARILQGPAWRIGYRDLVALARWSAQRNRSLTDAIPDADETPEDVAFALLEALDHLDGDEIPELSTEARDRLREFRTLFADLREASRGPLADLVAAIVERTGLVRELESKATPAATGARRNLANFAGMVATFSPVEGEATLSTLVAYLDAAEEIEDDFEPAQLSDANTVKLMTVHKAKGLEWPVVFVPGLAVHSRWQNASLFPDVSRQANPLRQPHTLPFELRGDRDVLPVFDGNLKRFAAALTDRGMEEERRLCYVALTRAKDVLVVSAAHWYGETVEPHEPGPFYREIRESSDVEILLEAELPEKNPLVAARAERVPSWPLPARDAGADALFPEGWRRAAATAAADPGDVEARAAALDPAQQRLFRESLTANLERAALAEQRAGHGNGMPVAPEQVGATALADYLRCPKLFYWSVVRPLPRRPSPAARRGTEIHRWIELESRGQTRLLDLDKLTELSSEERSATQPADMESLRAVWRASRFAARAPLHTERGFLLVVDGFAVGGRMDAVFGDPGGPWEIVDYKSGRQPGAGDPVAGVQLDVYALAAAEIWGIRAEDLTLTYFYLTDGTEVSRPAGDLTASRTRVREALAGIAAGRYDPTPSDHCHRCDFLPFCAPGRARIGRI